MKSASAGTRPVLLLDFDGTVCIGDAPVWAYAEAVISGLCDGDGVDETIRARLGAFLDRTPGSPSYIDGYAAVAAITADHTSTEQLQRAYRVSRQALRAGTLAVSAPQGLAALLDELGTRVERVLVTNAPEDGIAETLAGLGLDEAIDRVLTDAGKPAGWDRILRPLLADRQPQTVMAVGDIWANDIAEPLAAGCATALIDRFDHHAGPAHATATAMPELYPSIRAWADDPVGFVNTHPLPEPDSPSDPQRVRSSAQR